MEKKLYVGNLSFKTKEEDLRALFSEAGSVASVKVLSDRETGRSRGFGFVEMEDEESAQSAISKFDGYTFDGRKLRVNESRPQEKRSGGGMGGGNSRR